MNPEHVEGIRAALTKFLALAPDVPPALTDAISTYLVTGIAVAPWDLHEIPSHLTSIQASAYWLIYYLDTKAAQHVYAPEYKWLMRELSTNYETPPTQNCSPY